MREEKASALPLLLDVRRMDENNRAYAYRMLRKNIMTLQLQPGCQLSEAELCEQLAMSSAFLLRMLCRIPNICKKSSTVWPRI